MKKIWTKDYGIIGKDEYEMKKGMKESFKAFMEARINSKREPLVESWEDTAMMMASDAKGITENFEPEEKIEEVEVIEPIVESVDVEAETPLTESVDEEVDGILSELEEEGEETEVAEETAEEAVEVTEVTEESETPIEEIEEIVEEEEVFPIEGEELELDETAEEVVEEVEAIEEVREELAEVVEAVEDLAEIIMGNLQINMLNTTGGDEEYLVDEAAYEGAEEEFTFSDDFIGTTTPDAFYNLDDKY